jgi:hypothetical protein
VLSTIAIVPSAPVLVPELAGGAAAELAELWSAVRSAVAELPPRWVAVGVGDTDDLIRAPAAGTFAGYGADVQVSLSPDGASALQPMPLCALMAAWLRGRCAPDADLEVRVVSRDTPNRDAVDAGSDLLADLDVRDDAFGVLVVADGFTTLTPPAPGGYDPTSIARQQDLDQALRTGDVDTLRDLPAGAAGRAAYQMLAGLADPCPRSVDLLYSGAPYGVGYVAGVWRI